jgi:hypothetical protein
MDGAKFLPLINHNRIRIINNLTVPKFTEMKQSLVCYNRLLCPCVNLVRIWNS